MGRGRKEIVVHKFLAAFLLLTCAAMASTDRIQPANSLQTVDLSTTWAAFSSGVISLSGPLRLNGSSSGYSGLQSPATGSDITWTLPTADGTTGQVLSTNGSATLSFITASGGGGGSGIGVQTVGSLVFDNLKTMSSVLSGSSNVDIAYSSSLAIYVSVNGASSGTDITTSLDGLHWTGRSVTGPFRGVSCSPDLSIFVAVGDSGNIYSSTNGTSWTSRTDPNGGAAYKGVVWSSAASLFVAVSSDGLVATSSNGTSWTARTPSAANDWRAVTYGNGVFVAVGRTSGAANQVMTSPDGITWTARTAAAARDWRSVTYGNGQFAAVDFGSVTTNQIMTSPDGTTWTSRATGSTTYNWSKVLFIPDLGMFGVVDNAGNNVLMTSFDALTWTIKDEPNTSISSFVWNNDKGALVGVNSSNAFVSNFLGAGYGSGSGGNPVTTLSAVGSSPNANAATLTGNTLNLELFDSTHPGVAAASGGGTTNFLRADGTWAAAGGGGSTSGLRAYIGSTISGYGAGSCILFNTNDYTTGSDVSINTSTGRFTFVTAAQYLINFTVRLTGITGTMSSFEFATPQLVNISGTTGNPNFAGQLAFSGLVGTNSPNSGTLSGSVIINASAGAVACVVINTPADATNVNIQSGQDAGYISIIKQ